MKRIANNTIRKAGLLMSCLFLTGSSSFAQTNGGMSDTTMMYMALGLAILVSVLVLVVAVYVLQLLRAFVNLQMTEEQKAARADEPGYFARLWAKWNDFKPMEEEQDIMLDHDYDGIKELDNHLPPWWKGLFYLTIVYAVVYLLIFHVFKTAPLQEEQYEREMAAAEALRASKEADLVVDFDEETVTPTEDPAELADGQKFFETQCALCHKADGGGLAGPNLTDKYWKHGGSMSDVYKVIKNGVPNTAMISWESQLNPVRIRNVASYLLTLQGTNPPGALPPDGELYEPEN
ncbi:cbb3-type cytochrome c oxidase N-terminal domain-containing protein [Roseivirga pacifica]|nr:cbb3-type cytochrome c oxidase N-terminal domain-containing protein [Roseivirga pacifica]MCO6357754.1 c-type cytochrome [Roseivirga pacifica]MCO6366007.1 c-type cytochrome [Roseivirga pacifica]MCO6371335.1 c-type cytochrome [Roseivirga pacifica]MCO6375494.1 c-type cytochrome [Roseivirga pacifica]MCO6378713.1 c-type cytochrome [Roseivirga pacifica]